MILKNTIMAPCSEKGEYMFAFTGPVIVTGLPLRPPVKRKKSGER